jgi:hypothetical protein
LPRRERRLPLLGCEHMVGLLLPLIPTIGFLLFGLNGVLSIVVLEEQLVASRHEVEEDHLWEGFSSKDQR